MRRILLVGANGQVGRELQQTLPPVGDVIQITRSTLDLTDTQQIRAVLHEAKPDWIVNAAAYTAVDKAESEADLAIAINATAPKVMAEVAVQQGCSLLHLSTDYVFDGQKNTPYLEADPVNPLGVYARSKLLGEQGIQQVWSTAHPSRSYFILRTAWVYGAWGAVNFVKTMLRLGADREEIRVVADQVGSPTWAKDLAGAIAQFIVKSADATPDPSALSGIYHYTNSGVASWYDFAIAIFEEATAIGFPLQVQRVVPIGTVDYPTPAKRPAYSVLSGKKTAALLGTHPPHWRRSLRLMLTELYTQTYESTHSIGR